MKTLRLLVLLALAALALGVGLAQDKPNTLRLGHILNDSSLYHVSAVRFADALAKNSGGRLKVEIFPNGTLGFERDLIEGMRLGTIDAGVITSAPLSGFEPRMMVLDLPFIFKTRESSSSAISRRRTSRASPTSTPAGAWSSPPRSRWRNQRTMRGRASA